MELIVFWKIVRARAPEEEDEEDGDEEDEDDDIMLLQREVSHLRFHASIFILQNTFLRPLGCVKTQKTSHPSSN